MNIGVIFAGGVGQRMHSAMEKPKQFLEIYGKPIIVYTIEHFERCKDIDAVVVACVEEWIPYMQELCTKYHLEKVKKIVSGGTTGQMSIYYGLLAAQSICEDDKDVVLIHDGVRPLITSELLSQNVACVRKFGSAITSSTVKETTMVVEEDGSISQIPARSKSRIAKAPQSFFLKDILKGHEAAQLSGIDDYIDSCTMMYSLGYKLHLIDGPYENIKITTPDDFYTMRALLEAKENAQIYGY